MDFTTVPVLDISLAESPETKPQFLLELRNALVQVGFFYLKNHSIPESVQRDAIQQAMEFFDLPLDKKLEMETVKSKHFLGYNRMASEKTAAEIDYNESIALAPDHPAPDPNDPVYLNVQGPNQWPDEAAVPRFRNAFETYLSEVQRLAANFTILIAKALNLEPNALTRFLDDAPFSRLKVMKYPPPPKGTDDEKEKQGAGAHKDGVFMTYLAQTSEHNALEVQNKSGQWIPVPPIPGTLVVNIGRMLEIATRGVCTATTHRVTRTAEGFTDRNGNPLGPRLSIPFFQHLNLRLMLEDISLDIPPHIADLVKDEEITSDAEKFFSGIFNDCVGDTIFTNMLTSYPQVGKQWYPELLSRALEKQAGAKQDH